MANSETFLEYLGRRGVSRRAFLKFCAVTGSALALPTNATQSMAAALAAAPRPRIIWLSFQECTGCTESLTRSAEPTVENLILDHLSLDYHHTLQAAAGDAAEQARHDAMSAGYGSYVLIVDGAVSTADGGWWSSFGGVSNLGLLEEAAAGAALVICVGTCAAFGGLPAAAPNPSQAASAAQVIADLKASGAVAPDLPVINVSGCPPVPEVISGVVAHFLAFGSVPPLDGHSRPTAYFGKRVHDCCPRISKFLAQEFAQTFDDEIARNGGCLLALGCKGPVTYNACSSVRWNLGTSLPMHSGHGCLGCSEPDFWDQARTRDGGFYETLKVATPDPDTGNCSAPAPPTLPRGGSPSNG